MKDTARNYPEISFNEFGAISGGVSDITPELLLALGSLSASFSKKIAVGFSDCSLCRYLADAFISGAGCSGCEITKVSADIFSVFAYIARSYGFELSVFIENDRGLLRIKLLNSSGLLADKSFLREFEARASLHKPLRLPSSEISIQKNIENAKSEYISHYAHLGSFPSAAASVLGKSRSSEILRNILSLAGCKVTSHYSKTPGLLLSSDGMRLALHDENEEWYDDGHVFALAALFFFLAGGKELAAPPSAPAVLEEIAAVHGGTILRTYRDDNAEALFISQNIFTDGAATALHILNSLSALGISLKKAARSLPDFTLISKEITVSSDRRELLNKLATRRDGLFKEDIECLRVCADGGWVNISAARSSGALRFTAEGMSEEIASELCNIFIERALSFDKKEQN